MDATHPCPGFHHHHHHLGFSLIRNVLPPPPSTWFSLRHLSPRLPLVVPSAQILGCGPAFVDGWILPRLAGRMTARFPTRSHPVSSFTPRPQALPTLHTAASVGVPEVTWRPLLGARFLLLLFFFFLFLFSVFLFLFLFFLVVFTPARPTHFPLGPYHPAVTDQLCAGFLSVLVLRELPVQIVFMMLCI